MSQKAMNMHTSQISHGIVKGDAFEAAGLTVVNVGYAPAMVKIIAVEADDDPQDMFHWYSVEEDYVFKFNNAGQSRVAAFLEIDDRGFVVDGAALIAASTGTPVGFIFETYGAEYKDASADPHPDPVAADSAMDPIPEHQPE